MRHIEGMTKAATRAEQRLKSLRDKAVSCMSNSKWRRVVQAVEDSGLALQVSEWCFLGSPGKRHRMSMPSPADCVADGSGIDDISAMGPFLFQDVYFLHWPRQCRSDEPSQKQDVAGLYQTLMQSGELDMTLDHEGLTVWGYRLPGQSQQMNTSHTMPAVSRSFAALLVALLSLFILPLSASAQAVLKIELVSEQTAIVPGKPLTLGLWLQHPEGSHTYWRSPGIVGVPTQMDWQLPAGWKASELIYPEPERTFMYQIKAQGYDRNVMLRADVTPPADLKPGTQITFSGRASWMCCGNSCNPGTKELSITLPVVVSQTEVALNEKWHALFQAERARIERPSDAWTASTVSEKDNILSFTLKPATSEARLSVDQEEAGKVIVFTEDGWFDSDEPQTVTRQADGSLLVTLTKADAFLGNTPPPTLRAILRNEQGWLKGGTLRCLQIEPKIER